MYCPAAQRKVTKYKARKKMTNNETKCVLTTHPGQVVGEKVVGKYSIKIPPRTVDGKQVPLAPGGRGLKFSAQFEVLETFVEITSMLAKSWTESILMGMMIGSVSGLGNTFTTNSVTMAKLEPAPLRANQRSVSGV